MSDLLENESTRKQTTALSDETAKARRALIAVTALWAAITFLELTPTHISFLDIDLENARVSPQLLVAFVGLYLWMSFLIYGFRDWIEWVRSATNNVWGQVTELRRRRASDAAAEQLIRKLEAEGVSRTQRVSMKWPDYDQENTIEEVERSLPTWQQRGDDIAQELRISIVDVVARTAWEFGLPFGCGAAINGWLIFQRFS